MNFVCDELRETGAQSPKCHVGVLVSGWEEQRPLTLESHPRVIGCAENQAMGFDVPTPMVTHIALIYGRPTASIFASNWRA
jgi:hypothetical protein